MSNEPIRASVSKEPLSLFRQQPLKGNQPMILNDVIVPGTVSRGVFIQFRDDKSIVTDLWGEKITIANPIVKSIAAKIRDRGYKACANAKADWENLRSMFSIDDALNASSGTVFRVDEHTDDTTPWAADAPAAVTSPDAAVKPKPDRDVVIGLTKKWFDFFSEFSIRPMPRLMNRIFGCSTWQDVSELVVGYFSLTNHPDAQAIEHKARSAEFKELARASVDVPMNTVINKRFVIFYGDPGTGKTTTAVESFPEAKVMPCHSGMLSDDLYRQFDFTDDSGNPVFKDSVLVTAMKEGKPVILDEINLLTLECLRALQALLDNKTEVTVVGRTVEIKEGFMVIGTMNLEVGGVVYGLPDPLVDRASIIRKFELSANEVAKIACPEAFA